MTKAASFCPAAMQRERRASYRSAIANALAAEAGLAIVDRKAADRFQMIEHRIKRIRRSMVTVTGGAASRGLRNAHRRIQAARRQALHRHNVADEQVLQSQDAALGRAQASRQVDGHAALHSNHSDAHDANPAELGTHRLSEETF